MSTTVVMWTTAILPAGHHSSRKRDDQIVPLCSFEETTSSPVSVYVLWWGWCHQESQGWVCDSSLIHESIAPPLATIISVKTGTWLSWNQRFGISGVLLGWLREGGFCLPSLSLLGLLVKRKRGTRHCWRLRAGLRMKSAQTQAKPRNCVLDAVWALHRSGLSWRQCYSWSLRLREPVKLFSSSSVSL